MMDLNQQGKRRGIESTEWDGVVRACVEGEG